MLLRLAEWKGGFVHGGKGQGSRCACQMSVNVWEWCCRNALGWLLHAGEVIVRPELCRDAIKSVRTRRYLAYRAPITTGLCPLDT